MKTRKSIVFGELVESEKTVLKVITKAPEKWILVDTESMQFYQGCSGNNEVKKMWNRIEGYKLTNIKNKL